MYQFNGWYIRIFNVLLIMMTHSDMVSKRYSMLNKFTSMISPEIVSRQHDIATDKDIYLMPVSTSSV